MRSIQTLASTALLFPAATHALIAGFAVPSTIAPDSLVRIEILGEDYIQSVQDVAFSFGIAQTPEPDSLGTLLDSKFLGPDDSNVEGNITHYVQIPASFPTGPATISGALFSLYGALYSPSTSFFDVNVTVSNFTSSTYVRSSAA